MPGSTPDPWVAAFVALLSGGGAKWAYDALKDWRSAPPRELRSVSVIDANIATIARARDELIEDNARLRTEITEMESRHATERARWLFDQERLRADVQRLEEQIRTQRDAAAARYDALLVQVQHLRSRANEDGH